MTTKEFINNPVFLTIGSSLETTPACAGWVRCLVLLAMFFVIGCGTTNKRNATEQLIMSDAVDRAIRDIDFSALSGETVYLDDRFIKPVDGVGFVNAPYIISSLRQQLVASGCLLQDTKDEADVICEARVGTLGADGHEMTFGIPQSNSISTAANVLGSGPLIPPIPEISLAKSDRQNGAAKIGVFAYSRETKEPIWQSGIRTARSNSRDTWILGAGPWQKGTIHKRTKFGGSPLAKPSESPYAAPKIDYNAEVNFPFAAPLRVAENTELGEEDEEEESSDDFTDD
jgi:hypothetical protein